MTLKVTNGGERDAINAFLNISPAEDLILKLYKNDKVPASGDVVNDYTEADFNGYAEVALAPGNWTIIEGDPTTAQQPAQAFTSGAGGQNQPIYGYYVVGANSGRLKWAERFTDGPYSIVKLDDEIRVAPCLTGQSEA